MHPKRQANAGPNFPFLRHAIEENKRNIFDFKIFWVYSPRNTRPRADENITPMKWVEGQVYRKCVFRNLCIKEVPRYCRSKYSIKAGVFVCKTNERNSPEAYVNVLIDALAQVGSILYCHNGHPLRLIVVGHFPT